MDRGEVDFRSEDAALSRSKKTPSRTFALWWMAAVASAGCSATPTSPIPITLRFGGPGADAPLQLEPRGPIDAPSKSDVVLVAHVKPGGVPGDAIVPQEPEETDAVGRAAQRMAWIAQWVIQKELGITDGLGFIVILFPIEEYHACIATSSLPPEIGVAAGLPTVKDTIAARHATAFLYELVHWYVGTYFSNPNLGRCNFLHRSPENRWIADGMASLVAVRAISAALKENFDLAPMSYIEAIEAAQRENLRDVKVSGWTHAPTEEEPRSEALLRRAAAEYVCVRWYAAARRKGVERPIAELVKRVEGREAGPSYEEITDWMRRVSGFDVSKLADAVPIEEVARYHKTAWSAMGWKAAPAKP
jgi:hypothetical protein